MSKPKPESLKGAPPKLRLLLDRYDNDYAKVAEVLGITKGFVAALVHKRRNLTGETLAKVEMALGERDAPPKKGQTGPKGGPRKASTPGHPLLAEAFAKFGSWSSVGRALGYLGTGPLYIWNSNPERFDEGAQQRVRDLLQGKPVLRTPKPRVGKARHDTGELGIAIVVAEDSIIERVLDVAQAMNAMSIYQKRLTAATWLIIYRFTGEAAQEDMESFKLWASARQRTEVMTP